MRAVARKKRNEETWISWLAAQVWQAVSLLSLHLEREDFDNFDNFHNLTMLNLWSEYFLKWVLIFRSSKKLSECQNIIECGEMLCSGVTRWDHSWELARLARFWSIHRDADSWQMRWQVMTRYDFFENPLDIVIRHEELDLVEEILGRLH